MTKTRARHQAAAALLLALLLTLNLHADRTRIKPGWNMFSPQDDVELGRQASAQAEKELPLLNDRRVDDYLNRLGQRLGKRAPNYDFNYQFKAVNQKEINAFALPGGFLYVNRGVIEAAQNEAELAGVMAHEIAHVDLRHGTNQLTKAQLAQGGLAVLGGVLGGGGTASAVAQLGGQLGATFLFMKFSRTAETQADVLGSQMLYDAGYDPEAMADFFETLEKQGGARAPEFFSTHPKPENRRQRIEQEVSNLGGGKNLRRDSEEFHVIKSYVQGLPAPKGQKGGQAGGAQQQAGRPSQAPSRNYLGYRQQDYALKYPSNWEVFEGQDEVLIAPREGVGRDGVAYGAIIGAAGADRDLSLEQATNQLVQRLQEQNAGMRETGRERARVAGERALAVRLTSQSPLQGERETDWLFAVRRDDSLFYIIFIVPESDYRSYQRTFQDILDSIRFR